MVYCYYELKNILINFFDGNTIFLMESHFLEMKEVCQKKHASLGIKPKPDSNLDVRILTTRPYPCPVRNRTSWFLVSSG